MNRIPLLLVAILAGLALGHTALRAGLGLHELTATAAEQARW